MLDAIKAFFNTDDFMPHGHCFLWNPQILWLHVISDALIALSYFSIPFALLYFTRKRADLPFPFLFYLFGAFITFCGATHLTEIWVIWHPDYAFEGVLKALTAAASVVTTLMVWRIMPLALSLKSPQELEKLNAQLQHAHTATEEIVAERTAELRILSERLQTEIEEKETINARLKVALTAAEAAAQAKTEFLANMSHEIRTPMNAIVGLSSLLQLSNITPEKQKEFIKTIQLSSQSLMDLLNDLLDIAKLESEHVELEQVPFNLRELVDDIISIMSVKSREKHIGLFVEYDAGMANNLIGDPLRVRQVVTNLVSNAVKFTERGSVTIRVRPAPQTGSVCLDVTDTGIGIAPANIETIFGKFSQADTSITRKFGGTGLGLSICKTLARLMGGAVTVTSTVGEGSTFSFEFPLRSGDTAGVISNAAPTPGTRTAEVTPLILLVEDYHANILVATSIIESCGYRWEHAENGRLAVEKCAQTHYDLVLMDIQMPEMDGITATAAIRRAEREQGKPPVPIIGVTAYSEHKDRDRCLAAGMNGYIAKPFNTEDLKEKMHRIIMEK
jgi:signal transduction histidine kinase/ActR/RegA family two-component response regulator